MTVGSFRLYQRFFAYRLQSSHGITQLYSGIDPIIDIVAVHGLGGDALKTWTAEGHENPWLSDPAMLPRVIPQARILTWGYDANVADVMGGTSSDRILQHAQTLVSQLHADRSIEGAVERPIIFVCHSLGGIIAKRALAYSASRTSKLIEHLHYIYVSTYALLFLGTPHHGSNVAKMASLVQRMVKVAIPKKIVDTDSQLLSSLQEGSEVLQSITDQFAPLMKRFRIYFFWEQQKTSLPHTRDYIVDEWSAAPILDNIERSGIDADHRHMCKFPDRNFMGYRTVAEALLRYTRDAPALIARRSLEAKETLNRQRMSEASELTSGP